MGPTEAWTLISAGIGIVIGAASTMFTNSVSGDGPVAVLPRAIGYGLVGGLIGYAGYNIKTDGVPFGRTETTDPAALCLKHTPKAHTAVFERGADGSFKCSYKPL